MSIRREVVVRLYVVALFLACDVWLTWNLDPAFPVLLIPKALVTLGIAGYGLWTVWGILRPRGQP